MPATAKHFFPQLDGSATGGRNCGVSTTRSMISWATGGVVRPSVKQTRRRMGDLTGYTSPEEWEKAIRSYDTAAELGGKFEAIPVERHIGSWSQAMRHLEGGGMAGLAIDYGVMRRLAPHKVGSTSFSGYHGVAYKLMADGRLVSRDSLLDGRYPGCPDGPVALWPDKVRQAAEAVGSKELGSLSVYMVLVKRAIRLGGVVPGPEDPEPPTLAGIIADLLEALDVADSGPVRKSIRGAIEDMRSLIGPYSGEADSGDEPDDGGVQP